MRSIRLLAIFLLLCGFFLTNGLVVGALPPPLPDFTGTWKIDRDLSSAKTLVDLDDLTFVVSQSADELHVKRIIRDKKHKQHVNELSYFPDGRGEKVSLLLGSDKWNAKTNLINDTLVTKFTVTEYISTSSEFFYADYKETWALAQHGNTLIITTEKIVRGVPDFYRNSYKDEAYRKVFHRAMS